ncbi:MAG: carboxypeptidase regulatory-like domain-containing protein [Planctomycetota bacterium]|jgi:plastocyanin
MFRLLLTAAALHLATNTHVSADDARSTTGGTVSGKVTYQPDRTKPWRYSRYFIKNPKTGELAESVVALRSSKLRGIPREGKPVTAEVDQEFFQFTPQTVAIQAGDSVKFLNSDATTHNVRASSPIATFNENMSPGFDYTHRFDRAGGIATPVQLGCVFHGGMQAWIFIFDHPYFTVTGEDGTYSFTDVPPGKYRLDVYHPSGRLRTSRSVQVVAGGKFEEPFTLSPKNLVK